MFINAKKTFTGLAEITVCDLRQTTPVLGKSPEESGEVLSLEGEDQEGEKRGARRLSARMRDPLTRVMGGAVWGVYPCGQP